MTCFKDYSQAEVLLLLTFIVSLAAEKDLSMPVLIWESSSSNSSKDLPPGLSKLSTEDFSRMFNERLLAYRKLPLVLIFAEDKLSVEDFSRKDESGHGSYPRLAQLTKQSANSVFLPSVFAPIRGLKQVLSQHGLTVQMVSLNVKNVQKQDHNLIKESNQNMNLATRNKNLDSSMESTSNMDVVANSFPNQDLDRESIESLERNTETSAGGNFISKSVSKPIKLPEERSNEMSVPKSFLFRLSAATQSKREETRPSLLRRHDDEIAKAFAKFSSAQSDVIGIYTAFSAENIFAETRLGRDRRQAPPPPPPAPAPTNLPVWGDETTTILIYFHSTFPLYEIPDSNVKAVVTASTQSSDKKDDFLRLLVKGTAGTTEVNLALCFKLTSSSWELKKVQVLGAEDKNMDLLPSATKIIVGRQYSYTCRGDVVFTNGKIRFTLTNFQMQAYMRSLRFSKAQDCVSFFTIGIWCGVMVGFVMTVTLAWAITMIMNIKVNDKWDDPKGKTIHVGAGNDF